MPRTERCCRIRWNTQPWFRGLPFPLKHLQRDRLLQLMKPFRDGRDWSRLGNDFPALDKTYDRICFLILSIFAQISGGFVKG